MTPTRIGLFIVAYFLGSIPTGYWLGQAWKGIDIRKHGSGNVGATNVYRVLGPVPALFTFCVDCVKGLVPVILAQRLFPGELSTAALAGISAIVGHTLSVFVRFHGGKGMATATGVFAGLLPIPALVAFTVFITITIATRYVSLGSLIGALTLVACSFLLSAPRSLAWTSAAVAVFAFWTHRANIQRLLHGTENRMTWKSKTS